MNINNNSNLDKYVKFISQDNKIDYSIQCSGNSIFAEIEEILYQKYPEYREINNKFEINGKEILRFKTINNNNIKNDSTVILMKPS